MLNFGASKPGVRGAWAPDPHLNSNAVRISLLHLLILSMQVALLGAMDARENLELNIQSDSS